MQSSETWRPINKRYEVSSLGNVRNTVTGRILKPMKQGSKRRQYLAVTLPSRVNVRVHHLVLEAFVGPRPSPDHLGLHRNDDAFDNSAENLYWGTAKSNAHDAVSNGIRKLTQAQCAEIAERRQQESGKALAAEFGVSQQTICDVVKGRRRTFAGIQ